MSIVPADLLYSTEHEWVRVGPNNTVRIGITDEAIKRMKSVVDGELLEPGDEVTAGEPCGELDTPKANEEIYAPISGTIVASNPDAIAPPTPLVHEDCYGDGWLYEIEMNDPSELDELLDAAAYQALVED